MTAAATVPMDPTMVVVLVAGILGVTALGLFAGLYPTVIRHQRRARRLMRSGRTTTGYIRSMSPRPVRVGGQVGYTFKVEVERPGGRYPVIVKDLVDVVRAPYAATGRAVVVRVDDRHPDRVAIDWNATARRTAEAQPLTAARGSLPAPSTTPLG